MQFMENFFFQNRRGGIVFVGQDVIDRSIQGIAYMNQCGQRNFHTVIFNVADMAGIDAGHIGDIFLGQAASDICPFLSKSI